MCKVSADNNVETNINQRNWENFYDGFNEDIEYIDQKACADLDLLKSDENYKIVSNKSYKNVQKEVSELRSKGWELYKGIVVTPCNSVVIYTQVLVFNSLVH